MPALRPADDPVRARRPAHRCRRWAGWCGALALALLAPIALAPPAGALEGERERTVPVWPGVQRAEWRLTTDGGDPVRAQVVSVAPDAPVDLDLAFGQGRLPGLETVPSMARGRVDAGAVLGINGGFWRAAPFGRPDGFTALDGRLVAEAETQGHPDTGRGAFGVRADGDIVVDRITPQDVEVDGTGQPTTPLTGVNRLDREGTVRVPADGDDAAYLITDQFGSTVTLPDNAERGPARWRGVDDVSVVPRGTGEPGVAGEARDAAPGETLSIPSPGGLLLGYGDGRSLVDGLSAGDVAVTTSLGIDAPVPGRTGTRWEAVTTGVTGGPHILRDGGMTAPSGWEAEGFAPSHHGRQPRTAVGVTGDGTLLLVTVDGRAPDRSVGLGSAEMATFFRELGAQEAVLLDGGGSSTMTQDTVTVNTPSDGQARPVANAVFVQHRESFTATERLAGAGREHTAAATARAGFPGGADTAVIAAGGDFPDALAGGPLAAVLDAPLLLANPGGVSEVTRSALADLGVERVTVLGGDSAVPPAAVDQLESDGLDVRRVAGSTRFATAAAISDALVERAGSPDRVVLASGLGFADALVAAGPAGMLDTPILLGTDDQLPGATRAALRALAPGEVLVVGGSEAISDDVAQQAAQAAGGASVTRLAGPHRFATARAINEWAANQVPDSLIGQLDRDGLLVARGDTFPDALAGGPLAAQRGELLMIVPPWDVRANGSAAAYLDGRADEGLDRVSLLGGFAVLSSYQQWQLEQLAR